MSDGLVQVDTLKLKSASLLLALLEDDSDATSQAVAKGIVCNFLCGRTESLLFDCF